MLDPGPGWGRNSNNSVLVYSLEHVSNFLHNHASELDMVALAVVCPQGMEVRWASYVQVAAYLAAHKNILLSRLEALFEDRKAKSKSYESDADARLGGRLLTRKREGEGESVYV